jgi:hypothetical protein
MKAKPDSKEQQDDADFGKLLRDCAVCDEAWREWADYDAGQEVADYGRDLQPMGQKAKGESGSQAPGERHKYAEIVHREPNPGTQASGAC